MDPQYPGYGQGPQQNYGYPNNQGDGQYDFIMGQGPQHKRSLLPSGNTSGARLVRVVIILGIVFVLFIIGLIAYSMLTAGDKNYPIKLTGILQTQQELIRISDEGAQKGRSVATRNVSLNTNLTVLTDQTELSDLVEKSYNIKLNAKLLAAKEDDDTTEALADAEAANRYDEVYLEILETAISDYKAELQLLYDQAKTAKEKDIIQRSFDHMELVSKTKD